MEFQRVAELAGTAIDGVGVAVIVVGVLVATALGAVQLSRRQAGVYDLYRRRLGQSILLGLEFLVAGDIVRTVAVSPTFTSVGLLAVIVAIRTFLSISIGLEITGRWPWQPSDQQAAPR